MTTTTLATCTICGRLADRPYRRTAPLTGVVFDGCVAAIHEPWADEWHNRPEAIAMRADHERRRRALDLEPDPVATCPSCRRHPNGVCPSHCGAWR